MDRLKELLENANRQTWIIIGLSVTTIVALGLFLIGGRSDTSSQPALESQSMMMSNSGSAMTSNAPSATSQTAASTAMYVDVKGAVKEPGMKKVDSTMRVIDVVQLAGGFTRNADEKQVNLAQRLTDSQVVYIPKRGEKVPAQTVGGTTGGTASAAGSESQAPQVNLNTADLNGLQQLDGVGEKKAEKIIEYRQAHGQFQSIDELKNVNGFGDKTLERLKPQLSV